LGVDKAVLRNANQLADEGRIAKVEVESLTERIRLLERSASDGSKERSRVESRISEVETMQIEIRTENDGLRLQNLHLQLQNRLTVVSIVLGGAFYAMIRVGKWWAYPLMLLPLLWWILRSRGRRESANVRDWSSIKDVSPTLGACLMVAVELAVCPYLPKAIQPIAKNEFLWMIGLLATAGQYYVARKGGFASKDAH